MAQSSRFATRFKSFIARTTRFDTRFLLLFTAIVALGVLWWQDRQRLEGRIAALEDRFIYKPIYNDWSDQQALDVPNTTSAGHSPKAWASATPDDQPEWLEFYFENRVANPLMANQIEVYETFNPGAITKITTWDKAGAEVTLWEGIDPTPTTAEKGVSKFKFNWEFEDDEPAVIKIYIASDKFPGWNEIDAVGLRKVGWLGDVVWPHDVQSSSALGPRSSALGGMGGGVF